jgi:WD repeat-containing protein 23
MPSPETAPIIDVGPSTGNTTDPARDSTESTSEADLGTDDDGEENEEEDDDMDFLPARERDEEDEDEYESASEGLSGMDIEFEVLEDDEEFMEGDSDDDEEENEEDEDGGGTETELGVILGRAGAGRPVFVTREQIARLLGTNGLRRLLTRGVGGIPPFGGRDDDDSEEDEAFGHDPRTRAGTRSSRRSRPQVDFEKVPSDTGRELMLSGTFGSNERREDRFARKKKLASRLLRREMGLGSQGRQKARDGLLRQVSQFGLVSS